MGIPLRAAAVGPGWSSTWEQVRPEGPDGPDGLGGAVECVWSGRAGRDATVRVFPDGCADLTWDGERLRVVAATTSVFPIRLHAGRPAEGVRLRCGAAREVLGEVGVTGLAVDVREAFGSASVAALERDLRRAGPQRRRELLVGWVAERGPAAGLPPAAIAASSLAETAAALGTSERTARREVVHATGMPPIVLARVLRLRRFLTELVEPLARGDATLAAAAAHLGYADQSHLGRECRAIAGTTPGALVRAWRRAGSGARDRWPESSRHDDGWAPGSTG